MRPRCVKYNSLFGFASSSSGALDGFAHHLLICVIPLATANLIDLPIFRPNDYFYEHHQKPNEEKWETYARVIRDLMSEHGNIPIARHEDGTEIEIREKKEYRALLWPKKSKDNTAKSN